MSRRDADMMDNPKDFIEYLTPEISFEDLVLPEHVVERLFRYLREFRYRKLLAEFGLPPRKRLILDGPPGCGKTSIAHAMAHKARRKVGYVHTERLINSRMGRSARNVAGLFDALGNRNCILLLDEMDSIATTRQWNAQSTSDEYARVTNSFLRALDGYKGNSLIIGATNMADTLDRAVWRRFDDIITMKPPSMDAYVKLMELRMDRYTLSDTLREEILEIMSMNKLSMADSDRLCTDIKKSVVMRAKPKSEVDEVCTVIEMADVEDVAAGIHSRQILQY